jgi:hypothetical protein
VLIRSSILTAAVLLWSAGSALPDTIFFDDFNRANSNTVGNGWQEVGGNAGSISINNNQLLFSANEALTATEGTQTLSTIGLANITLEYDWQGASTDGGETLKSYWSSDGTNFTLLATHALFPTAALSHATFNLGGTAANQADITLRFEFVGNDGNDAARIDNVSLTGTAASVPGPLAGAGLPGLLAACGGLLALARRRRRQV